MDETTQEITRQEADAALVTLRVYAAQRQPSGEPDTITAARFRDAPAKALDAVGTLLDDLDGEQDTTVSDILAARYRGGR